MEPIRFVDTTLRDGQMSLWATEMRTSMMLPVADRLDGAGYQAAEIIGAIFLKKLVRDLKEDPWERLDLLSERITSMPLRAISNRTVGLQIPPYVLYKLFLEQLAAHGIDELRAIHPANTVFGRYGIAEQVEAAKAVGLRPIPELIYSISPKHTVAHYAEKARELASLDIDVACLKDPGGLLTPDSTRKVLLAMQEALGDVPVELHTHCQTGLGPLCCLEGVRAGTRTLHVAIPPLANASSNPSVFNVARNLATLGYNPQINLDAIRPIEAYLRALARQEGFAVGEPIAYDASLYVHQVPGGMISNLRYQLGRMGLSDRLPEVLEECARVRAEFGYPIMVTPYSQFVGAQATINIVVGERYGQVTDEVIQYALGFWGDEEQSGVNPDVRAKILDRTRAREIAESPPQETPLSALKEQYGERSDAQLLLRYFAGSEAVERLPRRGTTQPHTLNSPLVRLLEEVVRAPAIARVRLQKGDLDLDMRRPGGQNERGERHGRAL